MKHIEKKKYIEGQAMILAVLLFMAISMAILFGIAGPVLRQKAIVSDLLRSRSTYFLAEAGIEDVLYRYKTAKTVSSSEVLTINGQSATTTITNTSTGKQIAAVASVSDHVRKVTTDLILGEGVSFHYGVQVGGGGFIMGNNSGVNGNVYSNGNITASNGAFITGSAFAANSISLTTDQSNVTPSTPPNSIVFRNTSASQDVAQKFQTATTSVANKVQLYIKKNGSPANATVKLVTDSSGSPSTNVLTTGTLSASLVTGSYSLVDVVFVSNPQLSESTDYWLVIDNSTNSSSNYYTIGANALYGSGDAKIGQQGSSWASTSPSPLDIYFNLFLGGVNASISGATVGTGSTGDAWANTITGSTVRGNLYCQTGSGNNKSCNTSQADPVPQGYPVSDGNIAQWKSDATAGGTYNGNRTINGSNASLGPQKIEGNLTITNGANVTLTGVVWVTGTITVANNVNVSLSSLYGSNSGIILSDDKISLSNNSQFTGSGTTGSYIMLITTSDCPASSTCGGGSAIDVANNAGTVILNAQNGTIHFSNNSGAKEAVGYAINLDNGAVITYEQGLANLNFSSGPSGGYSINSWKETQ